MHRFSQVPAMPDFTDTLIACQQMSLLGADPAGAVEQAQSDFSLVGVAAHLAQLCAEMLEHGHPATLAAAEDGTSAKLIWRLPGANHPRDRYALAIEVAAGGATARFVGPARSTAADPADPQFQSRRSATLERDLHRMGTHLARSPLTTP